MRAPTFVHFLRRLWAQDTFVYSLRVFIALATVMGVCWRLDEQEALIPVFLGIIACALSETDDSWRGRLRAQIVTLACFAVAALSVKALFPYPWLFVVGLSISAFGLTMLGAIGERYRAIAYATLILAIYTTIGVEHANGTSDHFWSEPALLLIGATWYGTLSVLWCALFAHQPVQQKLAVLFHALGDYLKLKSAMFEPVRGVDTEAQRLQLAQLNSKVVTALNVAKESIFSRVGQARPGQKNSRYLALYFIAQDVHERASSSHYPYNELADTFFHSDIMFRCQRLLRSQGRVCRRLALAIQMRQPFVNDSEAQQAKDDLDASMEYLRAQNKPEWSRLLRSLSALSGNLGALNRRLAGAGKQATVEEQDSTLLDRSPKSFKDALDRIKLQLTPAAPLFRHALRLSIALAVGYGMVHLLHPSEGYWIVLTTLFVSAPSYGATRKRTTQRIGGTLIGLVIGWALFKLAPGASLQAVIAVVAGVVFFATRASRYMVATAAMTLLVLMCFNQVGNGYDLILPRMVDTFVGGMIAVLAVFVILPDWQGRRLNKLASNAVANNARYLRAILAQYRTGKLDDLAYRTARRNAHNADSAFSVAMSNILAEPGHFRRDADTGLRFLVLSHTLLNYLSGLGAHRGDTVLDAPGDLAMLQQAERVAAALDEVAIGLADRRPIMVRNAEEESLAAQLEALPDHIDDARRLVQTQLALITRQLAPIRKVGSRLLNQEEAIDAADPAGDVAAEANAAPDASGAAGGAAPRPTAASGTATSGIATSGIATKATASGDAGPGKPSLDRAHPA